MLLLTGGTGSLGRSYVATGLHNGKIRVYSRDEQKQDSLRKILSPSANVQLILGDIRDRDKLARAMMGCTHVLHTAALKVIPNAAYNPDEFIKTNIMGTMNVLEVAIQQGVEKVIVVSTDKACEPVNLYGATKMVAEHLAIEANRWSSTKISVVRYGNVMNSRGSFTNTIQKAEPGAVLQITDPECTRFWITLQMAVKFIDMAFMDMQGGEVFVPRLPSQRLGDMIPDGHQIEIVGLRQSGLSFEKLAETLITTHEIPHTTCFDGYFVIRPDGPGDCVEQAPYRSDSDPGWGSD